MATTEAVTPVADGEETNAAPTKVPRKTLHPDLLLGVDRGLVFDLGLLAAFSYQPIDPAVVKEKGLSKFLDDEGRDCTQLLLNEILRVPTTRTPEGDVLGTLPPPVTVLPREKHMPLPKPKTRWEKFAAIKGIKKKKKSKLAWDETEQDWKRRHGYDKANDEQKQWLVEVKAGDPEPTQDPWKILDNEKKERVKKQRKQEERNRAEADVMVTKQSKLQGVREAIPVPKDLGKKIDVVNASTASLGKFHEKLPMEPKHTRIKGKRKFEPVAAPKEQAKAEPGKKKAKKEVAGASSTGVEGAVGSGERKLNLTIFENLMKKQEQGDPSFVPDKKVLEMQKKNLGKRDRKSAY